MLSKAGLINNEIKSDLIYVPSAEERDDICSHLNGGVKAQGEILQCRLRDGARSCAFAFLQPLSTGCPIDPSSILRSLGGRAVGCMGSTAAVTGPPRSKIASISVLPVGEAGDDFRDGMVLQSCSSITAIFIPSRNAALPIRPQAIMEHYTCVLEIYSL